MYDPDCVLSVTTQLSFFGSFHTSPALLAYVGLGPGELLPYLAALLSVTGAVLLAIVQWPIVALLGWLKRKRGRLGDTAAQSAAAVALPARGEADSDQTC